LVVQEKQKLEMERKKLDEIIARNEKKEEELRQLEQKLTKQEMEHLKHVVDNFQEATPKVIFSLVLKF
jgi:dephospho-CoA kinase